jgi:hypothetical protein
MAKLQFSWLREAPTSEGTPGPFSFRRCLAALIFAPASVALFVAGIVVMPRLPSGFPAWAAVLPGALCLLAVLVLAICTTVGDIVAIINAARGIAPKAAE